VTARVGAAVASAALVATSGLAGCTPADDPVPAPTAIATERTPSPLPTLARAKGVVKDTRLESCELGAGEATASGTVVNTTKKRADFAITIAWMPDNSSDPVGVASTTLTDVPAGEVASWSITTTLIGKADRCAINARRGNLA
jgi:hypothetical protein